MATTNWTNQIDDPMLERGRYDPSQRAALSRRYGRGVGGQMRPSQKMSGGDMLTRGLGWFSLGLGLAQLLMPERMQKLAGIRTNRTGLVRMMGLRELGHAFLILFADKPRAGVYSRLLGDAVDLTSLGAAFTSPCHDLERVALATAQVAGVTALDFVAARRLSGNGNGGGNGHQRRAARPRPRGAALGGAFRVQKSITINRSPETLYTYWRNFENMPRFMYHLESVTVTDSQRSHWVAKGPAGTQVKWDAEISDDRPNELIAWRSLPDADVPNSGLVRFEPGPAGRGTVVRVEIEYRPPGGVLGKAVAKLFGEEPGQQVAGDLQRFKQVMEIGEVVRSEGSPQGMGVHRQRPAQPLPGPSGEQAQHAAPEWRREQSSSSAS